MKNCDVVIIGTGIVGLATAYRLIQQKPQLKIVILEKENDIGILSGYWAAKQFLK